MRDGQNLWQAEKEDVWKAKLDTKLDFGPTEEVRVFGSVEEAEDGWTHVGRTDKWRFVRRRGRDHKGKSEPKTTEKGGGKAKKTKAWPWSDVVKGLKTGMIRRSQIDWPSCRECNGSRH